jgi:hypothetical protein
MKRTTATQEVLRRLLNCSDDLEEETRTRHLNEYMTVLKHSGYNEKFREEVLKSGEAAYLRIRKEDQEGGRPMYRKKESDVVARWMKKREKKKSWQGEFSGVVFIPHTKNSELMKKMQKVEERMRTGGRERHAMKIVERAGMTIGSRMIRKNPFARRECEEKRCFPCISKDDQEGEDRKEDVVSCRKNSVGYALICKICEVGEVKEEGGDVIKERVEYIGESGQNGRTRGKKHLQDFSSKNKGVREGSAMYKHMESDHHDILDMDTGRKRGAEEFFRMEVEKAYRTPLDRQPDEGTRMRMRMLGGRILNSKMQWNQPAISRTVVIRGGAEVLTGR